MRQASGQRRQHDGSDLGRRGPGRSSTDASSSSACEEQQRERRHRLVRAAAEASGGGRRRGAIASTIVPRRGQATACEDDLRRVRYALRRTEKIQPSGRCAGGQPGVASVANCDPPKGDLRMINRTTLAGLAAVTFALFIASAAMGRGLRRGQRVPLDPRRHRLGWLPALRACARRPDGRRAGPLAGALAPLAPRVCLSRLRYPRLRSSLRATAHREAARAASQQRLCIHRFGWATASADS